MNSSEASWTDEDMDILAGNLPLTTPPSLRKIKILLTKSTISLAKEEDVYWTLGELWEKAQPQVSLTASGCPFNSIRRKNTKTATNARKIKMPLMIKDSGRKILPMGRIERSACDK
jgi:hypothetical protein